MATKHKGQWKKGQSGNPSGRPKGSGRIAGIRKQLRDESPAVVKALIEAAQAGDIQAIRIYMDKIVPSLKSESPAIELPDVAKGAPADQAQAAIQAAADGVISADMAATLVTAIGGKTRIIEVDEIIKRIEALEQSK